MKTLYATLAAALLAVSASTWAQTSIEKAPDPKAPPPSETGKNPDPGLSNLPDPSADTSGSSSESSGESPANTGIVKVPPSTGTENVVKPPENVDPGITEPTDDIDRRNRQRSEDKTSQYK